MRQLHSIIKINTFWAAASMSGSAYLHSMKQLLSKAANIRIILLLSGLVLFFNLYLFPSTSVKYEGKDLQPLDLRMGYSKEEVMDLFTKMGVEGRNSYSYGLNVIDSIYPFVYTALLILLLVFFINKLELSNPNWSFFIILPALIMLADFIENRIVTAMLKSYPIIKHSTATFGSAATTAKWILTNVTVLLLFTAMIALSVRFIRQRKPLN